MRNAILRGIYEDNLRIIGKHSNALSDKAPSFLKKMFLFFFIVLLAVLGHWNYQNLSLFSEFPEKQITASLITQEPSSLGTELQQLPAEKSVSPSDYKAFLSGPDIPLSRVFGLEVKTIMIDPGHGGSDSGTAGKMGTKEKDIALDIAKRLRERLKKYGNYNVLMTHEQDSTLPLNKRVELARLGRADLFISLHLNYLPSKPINIIETYYFGPSSDAKTLKLAERENIGSQYGLSDFKEIIMKIGDKLKLQESKELASSIQKVLFLNSKKHNGNVYNSGIKRAPFVVLLGVDVPAVLVEVSCLSNREEEIELNTESHRENIARYLQAGILDYLNKGEKSYEAKRHTTAR
ncbi:MAG: N-acetylmuramoyl-L-alanine amidase [Nitrospirota bacterium]|nr:N-acetylmuramoyl-L-alanine amidase [Nitrospirota bacterium]MDH5768628.1 N-acetylmuramoyl-L-alanine amidase [Nitrospirota bacterium]